MKKLGFVLGTVWLAGCSAHPIAGTLADGDHDAHERVTSAATIADEWESDGDWKISPPLAAAEGTTRVSAMVALLAPGIQPRFEARALTAGGLPLTEWTSLESYFAEEELHVVVAELTNAQMPNVSTIQLRARTADLETIALLRFSAVVPETALELEGSDVGLSRSGLRAELNGFGIVTREAWGARSTSCGPVDGARHRISIHHTEGASVDPQRQLRGIQSYHISKGWCDIGYHFLIDAGGTIYEGRRVELRGVHVRNNNTGNLGVSFIGCFDTSVCRTPTALTDTMIERAGRLVGTLGQLYGITPSATSVRGHRDQVDTTCPGTILHPRIRDIIAIGATSNLGGGNPGGSTPPPVSGTSCEHSFGGLYGNLACSGEYQCCEGSWRTRASGGCGSCACVEETGRTGCTTTTPPPADVPPEQTPPGAACTHSFGGIYVSSACSASYQCCDGSWRTRGSGCGACFCVEETGTTGCGTAGGGSGGADPIHAGLTQNGSEIPRAGLANPTLRSTLGISTEPYGPVVTVDGSAWVEGRVSWFGGPRDTGVSSTETGALTGERLRSLNDPVSPSASTLAARPADYYFVAMRWSYSPNGSAFWRNARILVENPRTGARVVVRPVDWGPNTSTRRIVDLSPQALADLGVTTDDTVRVAFAVAGTPLGRAR